MTRERTWYTKEPCLLTIQVAGFKQARKIWNLPEATAAEKGPEDSQEEAKGDDSWR